MKTYKKPLITFLSILAILFLVLITLLIYSAYPHLTAEQKAMIDATATYDTGNIDNTINKVEAMVSANANNIPAMLLLATSYAQKGSVSFNETAYGQKAIDAANKVLALDPTNSEAYRIIGYANEIMNKFDEARVNYEKAIALDPTNAQAYSNEGHSYDLQGNWKKASELYDKALSINPNEGQALLNKARTQIRALQFEDAKATIDHLIDVSANERFRAEANQLLAFVFMNQPNKDYASARVAIEKSLSQDITVPQAWVTRGFIDFYSLLQVYSDKEKLAAQIARIHESIDKALALNQNQASAYYLASQLAKIEGDISLSKQMKEKALSAIPNDITLGEAEKQALKKTIEAVFINTKTGEKI